ncbi:MAG: hypothetical protein P1V51_07430 [Deltaproteobacteria bacterium]|nr:hypothetical protein [Deltaproteobacteria bacterium]
MFLLAASAVGSAFAAPPAELSEAKLDQGEVFVWTEKVEGYEHPRLITTAVIDATPADVYEVTTNCDRWVDRMPRMKTGKTVKKTADSHVCESTLDMPFPFSDLVAVTIDKRKEGPDEWYRKWHLLEGKESDYLTLIGSYVFRPFKGDPKRTLLRYEILAIPKSAVPDFIRHKAQMNSMPNLVKRIRDEVKKL